MPTEKIEVVNLYLYLYFVDKYDHTFDFIKIDTEGFE